MRSANKVLLEISQNSQENTCARVSFLIKFKAGKHLCQSLFFNKVVGLDLGEISKNTFYYRTPLVATSVSGCAMLWYCTYRKDDLEKGFPSNNRDAYYSAKYWKSSVKFFRSSTACFRTKPSQNLRIVFQSKNSPDCLKYAVAHLCS